MKFLCGSCRTKYQISDDKVRGKILTIRCKKCGAKVVVKESLVRQGAVALAPVAEDEVRVEQRESSMAAASAASAVSSRAASASLASAFDVAMTSALDDMPTSIAPTPANEADAGVEWYVAVDGQQVGPFAYAELIRKLQSHEVIGRHYVWHDGFDNWKRVRDVGDLIPYLPPDTAAKKKPPPPPGAEPRADSAKVVDFAQKRAERERKGNGRGEAFSPVPGPPPTSVPPPGEIGAASALAGTQGAARKNDRLEQLDSVLNEALGIQGEGKTSRSEARSTSTGSGMGSAPGLTGEAFADDNSSDSFIPENLFDHVPRATASELVGRESTRFFVAAAGVNSQKRKTKLWKLVAMGAGVLVMGFFGLWAGGVIEISIPGIGNPFARKAQAGAEEASEKELSEEELAMLKQLLESGDSRRAALKKIAEKKQKRPAKAPGLPNGYVEDSPSGPKAAGSRGGSDIGEVSLGAPGTALGSLPSELAPVQLPGANPSIPTVATGTLNEAAIKRVVRDGRAAIQTCYQRELRGNQDLRGKLEFVVTVQPAGDVSKVAVSTAAFKGSKLADCIAEKMREWKFPAFDGQPQQIVVPFVLERASYD